jgi:hypothetical protein
MRKASLLVLIVSLFFTKYALGQDVLKSVQNGWERIYIKDVGYFDLPPTMEIQKGKYKEFVDTQRDIKGYETPLLTAQQKGVNDFNKEGFVKYARLQIATNIGEIGDFLPSNIDISIFTKQELAELEKEIDNNCKESIINSSEFDLDNKIIEWYPVKIENINGMICMHISYKRQFLDKPHVLVNIYYFQNNDREHAFTLSYRIQESEFWKTDFEKVLDSFRITNLK